ncbi:MAG: hypothetical protein EPO26_07115 [Chloroflexota bacterium]|nr:MAG: hypothetical protein EPO26_07115 [Chloroflexota bacterium]
MGISSRFWRRAGLIISTLILAIGMLPIGPAAAAPKDKANSKLLADAKENGEKEFRVIVVRSSDAKKVADKKAGKLAKDADEGDRNADKEVEGKGGKKVRELNKLGFVATVKGKHLDKISKHAAVNFVDIDAPMIPPAIDSTTLKPQGLEVAYQRTIGAADAWMAGITGAGVGVAVIDTGVNAALPDFNAADGSSRVIASLNFNPAAQYVADGYGHGTHVAGIIAGNSWFNPTTALQGKYIGVAPGAHIINLRTAADNGASNVSDVIAALDWAVANRLTYNIRVINLSMITNASGSRKQSMLAAAVERAWFSGIFVVVSAGNIGPNTASYAPANDPFVMVVGAADTKRTPGQSDDKIAGWSSYGNNEEGKARPDVVAPGRWIPSVLSSPSSVLGSRYSGRVMDPNYIWMSGTSMAAPVVAGAAALVLQAHPEMSNDELKWLMMNTSVPLAGEIGSGVGEINVTNMLNYTGTVGKANDGEQLADFLVGPDGLVSYSTSSWSTSSWSTSSWSTSSWSTSSWSTSSWSTSSWSTSSWSTSSWSTSSWSTSSWSTSAWSSTSSQSTASQSSEWSFVDIE